MSKRDAHRRSRRDYFAFQQSYGSNGHASSRSERPKPGNGFACESLSVILSRHLDILTPFTAGARNNHFDVADLRGGDARKALLILSVMTAHSFAEGVGVGVSFGGGQRLGLFITLAIALHNIPEGLAISLAWDWPRAP